MSKSSPSVQSRILITDSPQEIQSKITLAVADSIKFVTYNPINKPGISNLLDIYCSITGEEESLSKRFEGRMADELKSQLVDPHNCFEALNPAVPKTLVHNFWMIMIIGYSLSKSRWCLRTEWRAIERNMRSQATNTVSIKPMPPVVEAPIGPDVSPLFDRRAKPGWLKVFGMGAVKDQQDQLGTFELQMRVIELGSEKAASSTLAIGQSMQRRSTNLSLPITSHPISK
ncbi:hypothetical protein PPACK8108_LOCUS13097 [Phakopsora pachyrhizi]|uniref:Uncharacterized protein n=1 Tax=Phakopsora pachyrhizi TaxID=170000 RepID=A0AAV0B4C4_PHAPC|nr:hypothetical protein PPACK8108_LOCUS13097 [Phakopsora pachyrhizi]